MKPSPGADARIEQLLAAEPEVRFMQRGEANADVAPESGSFFRDEEGRILAWTTRKARGLEVRIPALGSVLLPPQAQRPIVHACVADPGRLLDAYQRFALPVILQGLGLEVIHASATMVGEGVTAFCGPSGSGKSTTAHALDELGLPGWADDLVVFDMDRGEPTCLRLPFRFRLKRTADGPPHDRLGREPGPRATYPRRRPLAAIYCLERRPGMRESSPRIDRLEPKAAFIAVYRQAVCFSLAEAANTRTTLNRYFELATVVPTFRLRYDPVAHGVDGVTSVLSEALVGCAGTELC